MTKTIYACGLMKSKRSLQMNLQGWRCKTYHIKNGYCDKAFSVAEVGKI